MDERSVGLNCVNSTMRQPPNWREADEDWGRCRGADRYNPSRVRPTMSSHWASSICAKSQNRMRAITTRRERRACLPNVSNRPLVRPYAVRLLQATAALEAEILILRHQLN